MPQKLVVCSEVAGTLSAEGKWNWRLESEDREIADGRVDQLRDRGARSWRHGEDALLRGCASKGCSPTRGEAVEVLRCKVDVFGVVLGADCNRQRLGC